MDKYDLIVIGGGISGLSTAHAAGRAGCRTMVLESSGRPGGTLHSHELLPGFWVELGAHTCYNSYVNLLDILADRGILDKMIGREKVGFKIHANGAVRSIPSQIGIMELLLNAPKMFFMDKRGRSVESFYSSVVGKNNYKRVFGHAFNAVLSQDTSGFPAHMMFNRRPRNKNYQRSYTFQGGLSTIADAAASDPAIKFIHSSPVTEIDFSGDEFSIKTSGGDQYRSAFLAVATPAHMAAMILKNRFPELSSILSSIRISAIDTVGVAVKAGATKLPPLAGIIGTDNKFFSAVSRDTIKHEAYRGFAFHFREGLDENAKTDIICDVLGINPAAIENRVEKRNFTPMLQVGHDKLVSAVDAMIGNTPLLLTGNYFGGLAIEDCIIRGKAEAQRLMTLKPA